MERKVQGQSHVLRSRPQLLGIRFVQAMPRGVVQVPERELPIELPECRKHDALDEHDPKEFPVLHERNAETAA